MTSSADKRHASERKYLPNIFRWQNLFAVFISVIAAQSLSVWLSHFVYGRLPVWGEILLTGILFLLLAAPILWKTVISPSLEDVRSAKAVTRLIIGKVPEGIFFIDAKGMIQDVNSVAESIFAYGRDQCLERPLSELVPGLTPSTIKSSLNKSSLDLSGRNATGEEIPLIVNIIADPGCATGAAIVMVRDISEEKRRLHELVESSEQLHAIFTNMKIMLALMDRDFNFIRVNEAFAMPSGNDPGYFVGKNHFDLYPDEDNEKIFRRVVETGEPYAIFAKPFDHPDYPGETTYWDWSIHPVKDETGRASEVLMVVIDATERQKLQEHKVLSEEKFRTVFDNVADAVFIHDVFKQFIEVNAVACQQLGYSKEEFRELSPADITEALTPEQIAEIKKTLAENKHLILETTHIAKDGRRIPVEINARLVEFEGRPAVLTVARDITERKKDEAARIASEENLRTLFDSVPDAVFLMKPDGTILESNENFASRVHLNTSDVVGKNVFELIPPDVAEGRKRKIQEILALKQPVHFEDVRDGRIIISSVYPILDASDGHVDRVAVYSIDATQDRIEKEIETVLHEIDSRILGENLIEEILLYACRKITDLFDIPLAIVAKKNPDGSCAVLAHAGPATGYVEKINRIGLRWDDTREASGPLGRTIRSGSIQRMEIEHPSFTPWREAAEESGIGANMVVPLVVNGEVYGALGIYASTDDVFDDSGNYRRFLQIASRLNVAIGISQDHERLRLLGSALSSANSAVLITNTDGKIIWVNPAFEHLTGYSAKEAIGSNPRILNSGKHNTDFYNALWETISAGHVWTADIVERHRNGTLFTVNQKITPIKGTEGRVTHFISIMEDVSAKKKAEETLEVMAYYDPLTGLPNRKLFMDRLGQNIRHSQRHAQSFALLFVDLDGFKKINDTHGHDIGDKLLIAVANTMKVAVRESDTVSRQAGDEFVIMLPGLDNEQIAVDIADKIINGVNRPFTFGKVEAQVGASIGIAFYPKHGDDPQTLLRHADEAMYAAKSNGRNRHLIYSKQGTGPR